MSEKLIEKYRKDRKYLGYSIYLKLVCVLIFLISGVLMEDNILLFFALFFMIFLVLFTVLFVYTRLLEELEKLKKNRGG